MFELGYLLMDRVGKAERELQKQSEEDIAIRFDESAIYTESHERYDDEEVRAFRSAVMEMGEGNKAKEIMATTTARLVYARKSGIPNYPKTFRREHAPTVITGAMDTDLYLLPTLLGGHNLASVTI